MSKRIYFLAVLIIVLVAAVFWYNQEKKSAWLEINGHKFSLEIAKTREEKEKGLSGRRSLCEKCGMLFVFPARGIYSFWMKDMNFNLDIIWIDNGKIIFIAKNVPPDTLETINPSGPADAVLEINGGMSDKSGIKIGDEVVISE